MVPIKRPQPLYSYEIFRDIVVSNVNKNINIGDTDTPMIVQTWIDICCDRIPSSYLDRLHHEFETAHWSKVCISKQIDDRTGLSKLYVCLTYPSYV